MRAYHSVPADAVLAELKTSELGISESEAQERLARCGENALQTKKTGGALRLFLHPFIPCHLDGEA